MIDVETLFREDPTISEEKKDLFHQVLITIKEEMTGPTWIEF